jgi:hypothetical protein
MRVAPVFSSPRTPRRLKALLVLVMAFGVCGGVKAVPLPDTTWGLASGSPASWLRAGHGHLINLAFVAAQWAGQMIGMEMGLNMSEMFDPSMGSGGSLISDVYYFVALAVFLTVGGHHELLKGVKASFDHLPLLSLHVDRPLFDALIGMLQSATILDRAAGRPDARDRARRRSVARADRPDDPAVQRDAGRAERPVGRRDGGRHRRPRADHRRHAGAGRHDVALRPVDLGTAGRAS